LHHPLPAAPPLVSLIVPTRDRLDLLRPCIDSLLERTDWRPREILICDNGSAEPETHRYFRDLSERGLARIVPCDGPFDFAAMNNAAARLARGRVLAFV
ncbi:glycosyl transferase, partial [Halomonas sp. ND22Bw]|uniref:glycosyltransferase family 2 protein n=1 Tax=Halomonas sp. ND22Bw TaxID=2054178 RepID=UPI000D275F62